MKSKIIAGFIAAILWSGTATATLINNGDFESEDLTGWKYRNDVTATNRTDVFTQSLGTDVSSSLGLDGYFASIGFDDGPLKTRLWQNFDVSGSSKFKISFDWFLILQMERLVRMSLSLF